MSTNIPLTVADGLVGIARDLRLHAGPHPHAAWEEAIRLIDIHTYQARDVADTTRAQIAVLPRLTEVVAALDAQRRSTTDPADVRALTAVRTTLLAYTGGQDYRVSVLTDRRTSRDLIIRAHSSHQAAQRVFDGTTYLLAPSSLDSVPIDTTVHPMPVNTGTRMSIAALLRVRTDDGDGQYVLADTSRSGRRKPLGPFGGAIAYFPTEATTLGRLDWHPQREPNNDGSIDLRGTLPALALPALYHWYGTGNGRERGVDALRRELSEELAEVGLPDRQTRAIRDLIPSARFHHRRTVAEEPTFVTGQAYGLQGRIVEIYDLCADDALRHALITLAVDPSATNVVAVAEHDIITGRFGDTSIGTQSRFLIESLNHVAV